MDQPIDAVVADLTRETASWAIIAVQVSLKQVRYAAVGAASPGTTTGNREEYLATAHGLRKYAQFSPVEGREVCVLLGYDDGERCASVRFQAPPNETKPRSITITKSFLHEATTGTAALPAALPYSVGLEPIRTATRRARSVGPSRVLDPDCTRYDFEGVKTGEVMQALVYHLDAATSFPLEIEAFADHARFLAEQPTTVWEVVRLDEIQGHHVATDSKFTTWIEEAGGRRVPLLTDFHHVAAIRFDDAIPAAAFWPQAEPGVLVLDRMANTSFKVGVPSPANPAPAAPRSGIYTAVLAVGLALLVVGLTWRRRKARS